MRLKLSFDDVTRLFRYLNKTGNGKITYEEFTMLLEERWRNIDPYADMTKNLRQMNATIPREDAFTQIYNNCKTSEDKLQRLEDLAIEKTRIPLKRDRYKPEGTNINRTDASDLIVRAQAMPLQGKYSDLNPIMTNVLNHDYMRRSMEYRV